MITRALGIFVAVFAWNIGMLRAAAPEISGSLYIESLTSLSESIAGFVKNATPDQAAQVEAQMGAVPEMARQLGIDPARPMGAVLLDPKDWGFAVVLPIADKQPIIGNPNLGLEPDGPNNYLLKIPQLPQPLVVTFEGPYALVSTTAAALDQLRPAAQAGEPIIPKGAQIELNLAMDKVWPALEPIGQQFLDFSGMSDAQGKEAAMLKAQMQAYFLLFRQTKSLGWRAAVQPESVTMSWFGEGLPGTDLEKFLNIGAGQAVSYLGALPNNGAFRGTLSIKPDPSLTDLYMSFFNSYLSMAAAAGGGSPAISESQKAAQDMLSEFLQTWDGTGAFSMYTGTGLGSAAYGITNQEKGRAMIEKLVDMNKWLEETGEITGASTSFELVSKAKYADADLYTYNVKMLSAPQSPQEKEIQERMRKAMGFDETMTTVYAVTPSKLIFSMGRDASEEIKTLVDQFAKPSPPADISPEQFGWPANTQFFAVISVPRIIRMFAAEGGTAPQIDKEQTPGMAMALILNGKGEFSLQLKAEELGRIINATRELNEGGGQEQETP